MPDDRSQSTYGRPENMWGPILTIKVSRSGTLWAAWTDDVFGVLVHGNSLSEVLEKFSAAKEAIERVQAGYNRLQTTIQLDTSGDELKMLRDVVLRAHGMTGGAYIQPPDEMMRRTHRLLEAAVKASPVMMGFLGRGGPCADRDILTGSGDLS